MHLTATDIAFRVRVSNKNGGTSDADYQFNNFAFVGVDANLNGSVDFFLGVYNPTGNNGRLGIYQAAPGYANTSPSTTGISGKPLLAFKPDRGVNYGITQATDGSLFNGDADYFVSFRFSLADIATALQGTGISFTASTPFRFMTGTAAQDNAFNQDLNGMDSTGWSSGSTWNSLNVFSNALTADGSATLATVQFDRNTGDADLSPAFQVVPVGSALGSPTGGVYATATTVNGTMGANMPPDPTRGGYSFNGWSLSSSNTTNMFDSSSSVSGNTTVYAVWVDLASAKTPVRFYTNDGSVLIAAIYPNGNSSNYNSNTPVPTKAGYVFSGWSTTLGGNTVDKAGGTKIGNGPTIFSYYAVWQVLVTNYTVSFNANAGGDVSVAGMPAPFVVTNGLFGTVPAAPTRNHYRFVHWNRAALGTDEVAYPSTVITANTTFYAIWQAVGTAMFDANDGLFGLDGLGDPITTQQIDTVSGHLISMPQPPYRDGCSFLGWSASPVATSPEIHLYEAFASDPVLYAVWRPIYQITFHPNEGNWNGNTAAQSVETANGGVLYLPDVPTRTGYTFHAWNTTALDSGTDLTLATDVTADTDVYAIWTPNRYDIHYVLDGGTNPEGAPASYPYDTATTLPVPTKTGKAFLGWHALSDLSDEALSTIPAGQTGEKTFYAAWGTAVTSVTFDRRGGTGGTPSVEATYGEAMPAASAPDRTGYRFLGYFDQTTGGIAYYSAAMASVKAWDKSAVTATLYAQWEAITSQATFDANGGAWTDESTTKDIVQTYGQLFVLPNAAPVWAGYVFAAWNTHAAGDGQSVSAATTVTFTENFSVYAIWTEAGTAMLSYAVNDAGFGSVSRAQETLNEESGVAQGSIATANTGYHFVRWSDAEGATVSENATLVPAKSGGIYVSALYTAEFAPDEDTPYTVSHFVMNTDGTYPNAPTSTDTLAGETGSLMSLATLADGDLTVVDGIRYDHGEVAAIAVESTSLLADGSLEVSLYYARVSHAVTLVRGTGVDSATGSGTYRYGETVSIGATLADDAYWTKWETGDPARLSDLTERLASFTMPAGAVTLTAKGVLSEVPLYTVDGDVVDENADPVGNASVKLMVGAEQTGATVQTDNSGNFEITNVPAGTYNLVITRDDKVVTLLVTVSAGSTRFGSVVLPLGNASSKLNVSNGTPPVVVDNLQPEAEGKYTAWGNVTGFLKVEMTIEKTDPDTAADEGDTEAAEAMAAIRTQATGNGSIVGLYLDILVDQYTKAQELDAWGNKTNIPTTSSLVKIIITLPEALRGKTGYAVYRHHGEDVTRIGTDHAAGEYMVLDAAQGILTLFVKNFSIYAVSYLPPAAGGTPSSSASSTPSVVAEATPLPDTSSFDAGVGTLLDTDHHIAYLNGYPDGTVRPEGHMTRGEVAQMFHNLLRNRPSQAGTVFSDVADGDWYAGAIGSLASLGILSGYPDGRFAPRDAVTREQFVSIAVRFARNLPNGLNKKYEDITPRDWSHAGIQAAVRMEWIDGVSETRFDPKGKITRAEVATIVNRLLGRSVDQEFLAAHADKLRRFTDLQDRSAWFFDAMVEAVNGHDAGTSDQGAEVWLALTAR